MFEHKASSTGYRDGRRSAGTTLIEVLVVIVILLVGILAIAQIFPKGFQLLTLSRKSAQATALAREASERLKTRPDVLPDAILPLHVTAAGSVESPNTAPGDLGPDGPGIDSEGILYDATGEKIGPWMSYTGPNRFRKIVGEARRISSPRQIGVGAAYYGSLVVPEFAPLDTAVPLVVTGNVLSKTIGLPSGLTQRPASLLFDAVDSHGGYECFVDTSNSALPVAYIPTGPEARTYSVNVYAFVQGAGGMEKRLVRNLLVTTDAATLGFVNGQPTNAYPLYQVNLAALVATSLVSGETLASLEVDSLRVSRSFNEVSAFTNDPFEYRVVNRPLGVLLFNPKGYATTISSSAGRAPLTATLDYAVADWRIIREDFRVTDARQAEFRLALGALKTHTLAGFDGTVSQPGIFAEPKPPTGSPDLDISTSQDPASDFLILFDTETGGVVCEHDTTLTTRLLVKVDKSVGVVQFVDADNDASNGTQAQLLLPDATIKTVDIQNRPLRVFYMARDEWAVQVLKSAAQYSQTPTQPGTAQFYVGGSNPALGGLATRIYFPPCDANQKVSLGELNYVDNNNVHRQLLGQDFIIRYHAGDPLNLPSVDITDGDAAATALDTITVPVKTVKGASLVVRVLWNPTSMHLSSDRALNVRRADEWGRNWRRTTVQTFIQRGENNR